MLNRSFMCPLAITTTSSEKTIQYLTFNTLIFALGETLITIV